MKHVEQAEEVTLRALKNGFRAPRIRELHVLPYPKQAWGTNNQYNFDPVACSQAFSLMTDIRGLKRLR